MRAVKKIILPALLLCLMAGCGFHLRQTAILPTGLQPLYIGGEAGGGRLARALRVQLAGEDTKVTGNLATAHYQLLILKENQEQRIVSLDRRGLIAELGLITEVEFELRDQRGERVLGPQTLQNRRTVVNNPDNVTTTNEEVRLVRTDMVNILAEQIVRRLAAYANQPHDKPVAPTPPDASASAPSTPSAPGS